MARGGPEQGSTEEETNSVGTEQLRQLCGYRATPPTLWVQSNSANSVGTEELRQLCGYRATPPTLWVQSNSANSVGTEQLRQLCGYRATPPTLSVRGTLSTPATLSVRGTLSTPATLSVRGTLSTPATLSVRGTLSTPATLSVQRRIELGLWKSPQCEQNPCLSPDICKYECVDDVVLNYDACCVCVRCWRASVKELRIERAILEQLLVFISCNHSVRS